MTAEEKRLQGNASREVHWDRWGPYLSERQWGTVREDYSPNGDAWNYFPHDHARSRAYRWGEDGIAGICDRHQHICFALALWNEKDAILKERLFGLTNREGNHGEDVKECYYYLDATPTSSYLKYLYKYPHAAYPYDQLRTENAKRTRHDPEYELIDTGIFAENRYFDVFVEYGKASCEDILISITAWNRGPDLARLHLLPTIWFRNRWDWGDPYDMPYVRRVNSTTGMALFGMGDYHYGQRFLCVENNRGDNEHGEGDRGEGNPQLLFTENETNCQRLYGKPSKTPYVKDAFHRYIIENEHSAINPAMNGTKAAAHFSSEIAPGQSWTIRLRFIDHDPRKAGEDAGKLFDAAFDQIFSDRRKEADEFYAARMPDGSEDEKLVHRQTFAGLIWNKQSYHYDVRRWLAGDPTQPKPDPARLSGRNHDWIYLYNSDVISMPDKWEYPWYAAWDLGFHCVAMALIDPEFAKQQLVLFLREWYMHPNGQLPAYEWNFSDVNPPVHAWAAWRVYRIAARITGQADRKFLVRVFHKLLLNFTWWVNRKDPQGMNVFQGGFLGLDNIGVFDRSRPLGPGEFMEQSDGTSWMAMYCLDMLAIAVELAREDPAYEDVASKFFEHFVHISEAMNNLGGQGIGLWNEEDGFYYDVLHVNDSRHIPIKVRSMVGLIPLFAVETFEPEDIERLPQFRKRAQWFLDHNPGVSNHVVRNEGSSGAERWLLTIANREKLARIYRYVFDENEFLSPYGIRSLSKFHREHPYTLDFDGQHSVDYEPAESTTDLFGGNSNWRGPVWFPLNFLLIESMQRIHFYYRDNFKVEVPTGSGKQMNLWDAASELSRRLSRIFLRAGERRPVYGDQETFQKDPYWRDLINFYEYFHGDTGAGLGASHQTGWTALVAKLLEQSGD
ncbi:MAG: MGH1-like glycoside hydrolase domain-containing protein [Candidatus Acidiferrales bacterium]